MVLFKDLNKSATDLLTRDFAHNRPWDVEFKHSAKNPVFTQNAYVADGVFEALSTAKYACPGGSLEAKLGTASTFLEFQSKVSYFPGLLLSSRLERVFRNKGVADTAEVSVEYAAGNGTRCNLSVRPFVPSITASAVACIPPASTTADSSGGSGRLGAEVSAGSSDFRKLKYSLGGSYTQSTKDLRYIASFRTDQTNGKPFGKLTTNIFAKAKKPNSPEYGVEVNYSIVEAKTNVAFVGMWPLDQQAGSSPPSTFLKAKLSHNGHFITALTHKVNDFLTATLGAKVDASKAVASPDSIKYGLKLHIMA